MAPPSAPKSLIRYRISPQAAVTFGESLLKSSIVSIVDVNLEDRLKAWEVFKKYGDKELSFTDCTSFVLMRNLKIHKAFTFDEHFKQIGLEIF